ncbi:MAG: hypothetical protein P4L61_03060 [Candidatus Pacebacteria bacterium]|nr:hypothetical protein [Candidatus Paceibacterota bacterium]
MIIQKICGHLCRIVSNMFRLGFGGGSWGGATNKNGARSQWTYLSGLGPATMIVRNGESRSILGFCAVHVEYDSTDEQGKVLSCKWILGQREKGDRVIRGRARVDREQSKLRQVSVRPSTTGALGCL